MTSLLRMGVGRGKDTIGEARFILSVAVVQLIIGRRDGKRRRIRGRVDGRKSKGQSEG
jgi:hypothetical protein